MASLSFSSQTESNHDTALTLACAGGHEELVQTLLERGASIEHRDKKGSPYFCWFYFMQVLWGSMTLEIISL